MYSEILTAICSILNACYTIHYSLLITVLLPRDRLDNLSYYFSVYDLEAKEVRQKVRTCTSHWETLCYLYRLHLARNLHIIPKHKTKKIQLNGGPGHNR